MSTHSRFDFPQFRVDLPVGEYTNACTIFLAVCIVLCRVIYAGPSAGTVLAFSIGDSPFPACSTGFHDHACMAFRIDAARLLGYAVI